jgi:large subunit ribosomal protein L24
VKLKKGDKVVVIAGSNKGKEGIINKILDNKVIVEGVNIVKKHLKPKNNNGNGEIVEREAPIHVSNVKLIENKKSKEKSKKTEIKAEVKAKKSVKKD